MFMIIEPTIDWLIARSTGLLKRVDLELVFSV